MEAHYVTGQVLAIRCNPTFSLTQGNFTTLGNLKGNLHNCGYCITTGQLCKFAGSQGHWDLLSLPSNSCYSSFMGSILQAKCSCGFTSKEMHLGCGEMADAYYIPVACPQCKRIWVATMSFQKHSCRKCQTELLNYDDPANYSPSEIAKELKGNAPWSMSYIPSDDPDEDDKPMPQMKYKCPSCGKIEMEFEWCGLWD